MSFEGLKGEKRQFLDLCFNYKLWLKIEAVKNGFSLDFHRYLYNKQNITCPLVDTNLIFWCWEYLSQSERSELVRDNINTRRQNSYPQVSYN